MKPEDLDAIKGAVGETVKDHFDSFRENEFKPMRTDVTEIRRVQGLQGERIKGVESRLNGVGDCAAHAEKVAEAKGVAKTAKDQSDKNWTFIRVLVVGAITGLIGIIGGLLVWGLGLIK